MALNSLSGQEIVKILGKGDICFALSFREIAPASISMEDYSQIQDKIKSDGYLYLLAWVQLFPSEISHKLVVLLKEPNSHDKDKVQEISFETAKRIMNAVLTQGSKS